MNSTPHTSYFLVDSHLMTRTCVAQAQVWRAQCAFHIISCVIFMRSCCVFDSTLPSSSCHFLSYRLVHLPSLQLLLPRCGGQIPCALPLTRTLAPLPSTTLSQEKSDCVVGLDLHTWRCPTQHPLQSPGTQTTPLTSTACRPLSPIVITRQRTPALERTSLSYIPEGGD